MKRQREKTALVVIDVQKFFINEHTRLLPTKIARFIELNKFDLVIFSNFVNNRSSVLFNELKWQDCLKSPDIDIAPELDNLSKKYKIIKRETYSVFNSKNIINLLVKDKIKKVYLCGIDIDACVIASAFDGIDMGYKVYILNKLSLSSAGTAFNKAAKFIIKRNLLSYA